MQKVGEAQRLAKGIHCNGESRLTSGVNLTPENRSQNSVKKKVGTSIT